MPTMSSTWIEERPGDHGGSPVARRPHRDGSEPCSDVFSNISNQSAGSGRSSGVRRFGDIFRNRLKLAGVAAMRTFNESFPQECKIHTDEENGVETPSPKGAKAVGRMGESFDRSLDAVLVNERAAGRRDRTFTERSNTLAGTGGTAMTGKGAVGAGGGGAGAGGLRSRRSSTMFRQRTTLQRTSSGINAKTFTEDEVSDKSEPTTGKGGHPRHTRKEDSKKTKPDDAAPVAPRTTDYPGGGGGKALPVGERGRLATTHPRTSIVHREPVDEVVVGKPPSRERVNSTSHYSTEKSGSSGYYSTNLYSTGGSSVDEHIYCEPIDRRSPRTERLDDEEEVPAERSGSDPVSKPASQGAGETGKTGASCDRNRRGNDQELSELQRNIRGLEQYYYPSPLASPAVPVQLSVMRASVIQQQPLHSSAGIGPEGEPRPESGCEVQDQQQSQEQQEQQQLSVIMEGNDGQIPRPIWPLDTDDSLMDINLESFRMANHSSQNLIGFESPSLSSISESEMYAIRDQAMEGAGDGGTQSRKKSQYEEYLEFHNTRNILEQIRGKLNTLLEQRTEQQQQQKQQEDHPAQRIPKTGNPFVKDAGPSETELEKNIAILKADLDGYLRTMNQKNENEIRRFCKGMSREPKVVAVQNAVEQRNRSRSGSILSLEHDYEMLERAGVVPYPTSCGSELPYYQVLPPDICEGRPPAALPAAALMLNRRSPPNPFAQEVRQQGGGQSGSIGGLHSLCCQQRYLNSDEIRVCNRYGGCERTDPNAMTIDMPDSDDGEVGKTFVSGRAPAGGGGVDCRSVSIGMPEEEAGVGGGGGDRAKHGSRVKLKADPPDGCPGAKGDCLSDSGSGGPHMAHCDFNQLQRNITLERIILMESLGKSRNGQFGDKEKMLLEWHQNKPSCWELYYGANREEHPPHQTLIRKMKLGRKSTVCISYPSTRPESDFTLDVPRAEQLRLKMKKEKQFRSRCRWFFYFLSIVFFLLSVMVVSLILTRGKRMFGSMI
ncbi:uncharacterized protein LOC121594672 [Anopheles merus]|uniref:uncharacterized protein LOC121594672 n=1 Tax=Anopheles merus TaxID=30066 RepID=UPI001BE43503|nr:uncharacterized protein LOC121594672 [Anopheles merus]